MLFDNLYEWMKKTAYFIVLVTVLLHIVPNEAYRKYIRFFTGILLAILLMTPAASLMGAAEELGDLLDGRDYEAKMRQIEEAVRAAGETGEETEEQGSGAEGKISVEEIRIGQ